MAWTMCQVLGAEGSQKASLRRCGGGSRGRAQEALPERASRRVWHGREVGGSWRTPRRGQSSLLTCPSCEPGILTCTPILLSGKPRSSCCEEEGDRKACGLLVKGQGEQVWAWMELVLGDQRGQVWTGGHGRSWREGEAP